MWSRLFLTSLCLLSVLALRPLPAAEHHVQLTLSHQVDSNCDGIADIAAPAIPGSCIIYGITVHNTGPVSYHDVVISAQIPKHTTIAQAYQAPAKQQALASKIVRNTNGERRIETRLDTLPPGSMNPLKIHYSVKVD